MSDYPHLSRSFMRGSLKGQVLSVHRDRFAKPDKVLNFREAVAAADISLGTALLPKHLVIKLVELGIPVPPELVTREHP